MSKLNENKDESFYGAVNMSNRFIDLKCKCVYDFIIVNFAFHETG